MKILYVIRHAKSSWDDAGISDMDRPLNERGKADAPRMGKRLKEKAFHPDLMLSSPARRAFSTCVKIAKVIGYPESDIKTEAKLYHAGKEQILAVLKNMNDQFNAVMIFGHNPGLTEFVNSMSSRGEITNNLPTCGVVAFELPVSRWADASLRSGKVILYDFPKSGKD